MLEIWRIFADIKDKLEEGTQNIPNRDGSFNVQTVLNWVYMVMGVVAVGFIIHAGFSYINSQGQPDRTKKASQSLAFSVIGLAIILLAAAITNFVFATIGGA